MINYLFLALGLCLFIVGFLLNRRQKRLLAAVADGDTEKPRRRKLPVLLSAVGLYAAAVSSLTILFGKDGGHEFVVEVAPERFDLLGFEVTSTMVLTWLIIAALLILSIILRLTLLKNMKAVPKGFQNVVETVVEYISRYTDEKVHNAGGALGAYIFTLAVYLVCCAVLELFGLRSPVSDITMTGSLALITFILINYYGFSRKGPLGRMKTLASPSPLIFPMNVISGLALPVSMACRLFGNTLGGLIVMELIYVTLGNYAVGLPSILALYFNVFHPLIQAFIFITLTLTFINEAVE